MSSVTYKGYVIGVPDLACNSVLPALTRFEGNSGWVAWGCVNDPVKKNTAIHFYQQSTSKRADVSLTAIVDAGPASCTTQECLELFDYHYAAQVWVSAFSVTIGLYLIAFKVGTILKIFRRI